MKKEINIVVVIVLLSGGLVYWAMNNITSTKVPEKIPVTSSSTSTTGSGAVKTRNPSIPGQVTGNITVKIDKVDVGSKKIFYTMGGKQYSVTISSDTKLAKQVNVSGIFKDVSIGFSDLKPTQFVELDSVSIAGAVASVRVLN